MKRLASILLTFSSTLGDWLYRPESDTMFQISLAHVSENLVMVPQVGDTIGTGLLGVVLLGKLNPKLQGPILAPVVLDKSGT